MKKGKGPSIDDLAELNDGSARKTVDRLSWDFSSCPDSDIDECHAYEFARNVSPIRLDVAGLRKGKKRTFDDLFGKLNKIVFAFNVARRYALFWFHPEFPEKPYLSIPLSERRRRFRAAWPIEERAALAAALSPKMLPHFLGDDLKKGLQTIGRPSIRYGSTELALIEIDWNNSNERLLNEFAAWLSEGRPKEVRMYEEKGAGNFVRQRRADLKALGAWRLLKWMSWEEAFLLTRDGNSRALYSNHPRAWETAKKRAHSILRHLVAGSTGG